MENYFWNTEDGPVESKKSYVLVIYDIVDNKRRTRFAKRMQGYGFRVQKSAFEAMVPKRLYEKMLAEIPRFINKDEDSVRVYHIMGRGDVSLFGVNDKIEAEDVIII